MASKVIGVMLRHDDGDKEYYEPQFTEEDINAIYKILDKYGDKNDSKRGELEVVDMTERIDKLFKAMRSEIGVMAEYGDNEDQLKEELSTCGEEILREYEKLYIEEEIKMENKQEILNAICAALRLTDNAGRGNALKEIRYMEDKGSEYAVPIFENGNGEPDEYCPHGYYGVNITGDSGTAIFKDITKQFINEVW